MINSFLNSICCLTLLRNYHNSLFLFLFVFTNLGAGLPNGEAYYLEKHLIHVFPFLFLVIIGLVYFMYSRFKKHTSELKRTRDIAKHNEEKYRLLAENTSDVVWLSDLNFNASYISPSVEKMLGGKVSDHLKMSVEEKIPNKKIEEFKALLNEALEKETTLNGSADISRTFELEHYHTNGSLIWVEINVSLVRDIAKHNEEKYRLLAENTTDVVWLSDLNLNASYISPSVEKMLGGKVSDHLKMSVEEKIPNKKIEEFKALLNEALEKEKSLNGRTDISRTFELEHYHTDGSLIWVEMNVSLVRDENGKPIGLNGITRDINEKVKARQYLEKRLAMEKLLSKISRIAIGDSNIDAVFNNILKNTGTTLDVSRAYIFTFNSKDNTVSNTFEWCAPDVLPQINNLQKQNCSEFPWFFNRLKQGKIIKYKNIGKIPHEPTRNILRQQNIVSIIVVPLILKNCFYGFIGFDECRTPKGWNSDDVKVLQSLSYIVTSLIERHKKETELRIKDWSLEYSQIGIAMSDLEGKITYANNTFLKYWRYQNIEEVLSKTVFDFWESNDESSRVVSEIKEKGSWEGELTGIRNDRTLFDVLVQASLVKNKEGEPICMQASFFDITERKKWIKELIHAKEKAEESNRLKSAFLANLSHEIRTPMNGIIGFLNLLKDVNFSDEKEEIIHILNESGKRLMSTINDIIECSIIEVGETIIDEDVIQLTELMNSTFHHFKPEAEKKNLFLKKNNKVHNLLLKTDKAKLERILHKLVSNAIKFTETGSVEFSTELIGEYVRFRIKDTGIGISEDRIDNIFEPFIQADMGLSRRYEGSGLGLSISRAYVEQLGGRIWLSSKKGEGSIFFFTIPYKPVNLSEISSSKEDKMRDNKFLSAHKILIAEDDQFSYLFLEASLRIFGAIILHTETGDETIEALLNNPDISLILMDIKMPGLNGIEATRKIREFNSDVPIIAQTALIFTEEKNKVMEAGCNDYISKPIDKELLLQKIKQLLN